MEKKLLTVTEVQSLLSVGRTKVFLLIASGELESVLVGSSRRIPSSAIDDFIKALRANRDMKEPEK